MKFLVRYHLLWVALYLVLFGGTALFAADFYREYDEDRLPSGSIELAVDREQYEVGDVVAFSVTNHFPTPVYVPNQCPDEPLNVYAWRENAWHQLHEVTLDEESPCHREERSVEIPPEGSRGYNFAEWPQLFDEPGIYRIALAVDHYREVPFRDFVVVAKRVPEAAPAPSVVDTPRAIIPPAVVAAQVPAPEAATADVVEVAPIVTEDEEEEEENEEERDERREHEEEEEDE